MSGLRDYMYTSTTTSACPRLRVIIFSLRERPPGGTAHHRQPEKADDDNTTRAEYHVSKIWTGQLDSNFPPANAIVDFIGQHSDIAVLLSSFLI